MAINSIPTLVYSLIHSVGNERFCTTSQHPRHGGDTGWNAADEALHFMLLFGFYSFMFGFISLLCHRLGPRRCTSPDRSAILYDRSIHQIHKYREAFNGDNLFTLFR